MLKGFENNQVKLVGEVIEEPVYNHEMYGEEFYLIKVKVIRNSGTEDVIPVMVSERVCDVNSLFGKRLRVSGQLRSFNCYRETKRRLILSVFVRELEILDDKQESLEENEIFLDGYICKEPVYRKTLYGREITDMLIAANRSYGKSDYIPCICWGRNARFASGIEVGTRIQICGRIQSREYTKKISETESEVRTAYEVSASRVEVMYED